MSSGLGHGHFLSGYMHAPPRGPWTPFFPCLAHSSFPGFLAISLSALMLRFVGFIPLYLSRAPFPPLVHPPPSAHRPSFRGRAGFPLRGHSILVRGPSALVFFPRIPGLITFHWVFSPLFAAGRSVQVPGPPWDACQYTSNLGTGPCWFFLPFFPPSPHRSLPRIGLPCVRLLLRSRLPCTLRFGL